MIPMFFTMHFRDGRGRWHWFWFPVILLWPLLLILVLLALPFVLIAEVVLANRGIHPFKMLIVAMQILASLRGMVINIKANDSKKGSFRLNII